MPLNLAGPQYAQYNPLLSDANYGILPMYGLLESMAIAVAGWIPEVDVEPRSREQRVEMRGFDPTRLKAQGDDLTYESIEQQGGKIEIHLTYAQGVSWSLEFGSDVDTQRVIPAYLKELGNCANERRRILFCAPLNDAFSGSTYTTNAATGLSLCNASHVVQGGTVSNLITGDLGVDTLETAWKRLMAEVDYRNKSIGLPPKYLTVHTDQVPLATQLVAVGGQPDVATNATNFMGGKLQVFGEVGLTDTDSWFVSNDRHTLHLNRRQSVTPMGLVVDKAGNSYAGILFRASPGFDNRHGIVGSQGA